ncbi:hypothetical protein SAMN04488072_10289 [Lentibacillus halodurans]|uniref:Uncharacterized protein n=1 Tax=Lentibacillus halodurans TaxID=237679 RepID=A0A1I0W0R5_9BACI|nr:hypothetical protein SAMN04488072_10289 [Lentibacillus halodurans]
MLLPGWVITLVTQIAVTIGFLKHLVTAMMAFFPWQISEKFNNVHHGIIPLVLVKTIVL